MILKSDIYRNPKWKWTDFVKTAGARDAGYPDSYGWSITGYAEASGQNRSCGARIIRTGSVLESTLTFTDVVNGQYLQFSNLTQNDDIIQIKFDPTKIIRFWYRYSAIKQIMFDLNQCKDLTEISLRKNYHLAFGALNLSNLSKLQVFEISDNASIDSVSFHASAPIIRFYVSNTTMPSSVMDSIILQAYNKGLSNGFITNSTAPSETVCAEADALVARGWTINVMPTCGDTTAPTAFTLSFVAATTSTIDIEWTASSDNVGLKEYHVGWSYTDKDGVNVIGSQIVTNTTLAYQITMLPDDTTVSITVKAIDTSGNETASNTINPKTNVVTYAHTLAQGSNACADYGNGLTGTYYLDTNTFNTATKVWSNSAGTTTAPVGDYSDGVDLRYWDGTTLGAASACPITM